MQRNDIYYHHSMHNITVNKEYCLKKKDVYQNRRLLHYRQEKTVGGSTSGISERCVEEIHHNHHYWHVCQSDPNIMTALMLLANQNIRIIANSGPINAPTESSAWRSP